MPAYCRNGRRAAHRNAYAYLNDAVIAVEMSVGYVNHLREVRIHYPSGCVYSRNLRDKERIDGVPCEVVGLPQQPDLGPQAQATHYTSSVHH